MKTKKPVKVVSHDQQENLKNVRKTLKVLQPAADKENLVGRTITDTKLEGKSTIEVPAKTFCSKAVQTGECTITAADLTCDEPSTDYWKRLAEKRQESLDESLKENERLKEHVEALKEENKICKEMLEESKNLVEVLQEMLAEGETTEADQPAEEVTEDNV